MMASIEGAAVSATLKILANKLAPSSRPGWVPGTSGDVEEREGGRDRQRGTRPI